MDVGDYSSVSESDEGVVDKVAVNRTGVEDLKVVVLDAGPSEIGVRISPSVQRHAIDRVALLATPLYCHSVSHGSVLDISGHFGLPLLINKDELIVIGVRIVIRHPSVPRMISVLISLDAHVSNTR